jgi:hypothetical protein
LRKVKKQHSLRRYMAVPDGLPTADTMPDYPDKATLPIPQPSNSNFPTRRQNGAISPYVA